MIFFQDEVQVADLTKATAQFALYGPRAGDLLGRLSGLALGLAQPHRWLEGTIAGAPVSVHRGGPLEAWAWTVVTGLPHAASVRTLAGGATRLSPDAAQLLRIEAGIPAWGRELSDQVTPLETGLLPAISFNKGCYTGQEVIARQTNYDKVTRNLVGLTGVSTMLHRKTGTLSETGWLRPRGPARRRLCGQRRLFARPDKVIGLAVVPRDLAQPGTAVEVVRGDQTYRATVTLPIFD